MNAVMTGNGDSSLRPLSTMVADPERAFPTLSAQLVSRIAAHGHRRRTVRGEVLFEAGAKGVPVFVVLSGELRVVRQTETGETLIATYHAGQFSGESNMLTGRRALAQLRVAEAGDVIQLDRDQLLALIQTDAEFSEIAMGAFIQRRLAMIAGDMGD